MTAVIYPGSFDPVTYGHLDIIQRAASMFDKVIVGIFNNPDKKPLFSIKQRVKFLRESIPETNVDIVCFDGLLAEYTRQNNINAVIRGLRAVSDFEYEFQMALTNRKLNSRLETIFLPSREKFTYLSSSMVKTIAKHGGDVREFAPDIVAKELHERLGNEGRFDKDDINSKK